MDNKKYDDIFMKLAIDFASHSHCVKRHVGAVLTKDTRVISTGYNGPLVNMPNCDEHWPEKGCPKDSHGSCSHAIHAEQNALQFAWMNGARTVASEMFVTLSPCMSCARMIAGSGVTRVVYLKSYAEYKGLDHDEGVDFLQNNGIMVEKYRGSAEIHDPLI